MSVCQSPGTRGVRRVQTGGGCPEGGEDTVLRKEVLQPLRMLKVSDCWKEEVCLCGVITLLLHVDFALTSSNYLQEFIVMLRQFSR